MNSLALVESRTIAGGIALLDMMVKKADVAVVRATPICSGRFMIVLRGAESEVLSALGSIDRQKRAPAAIFHLSGTSEEVFAALTKREQIPTPLFACGVIETRHATAALVAADSAVKAAAVDIVKLSLARGINGKGWVLLGGDTSAVKEGVGAVVDQLTREVVDSLVLPNPDDAVVRALVPHYGIRYNKDIT